MSALSTHRRGGDASQEEFYDYDDKYVLGLAETVAPTDLEGDQLERTQRVALAAGARGAARWRAWLASTSSSGGRSGGGMNEVNTMPGFTPISMFPMLWEAEGLPFGAVVEELVTPGAGPQRPPAAAPPDAAGCSAGPASATWPGRPSRWGTEDPVRPRWAQVRRVLRAPPLYRAECGHDVRGLGERHLGHPPGCQPPHGDPARGHRVGRAAALRRGGGRRRQDEGADAPGGPPGTRRVDRARPHPGHHVQPQGRRGAAHPAVLTGRVRREGGHVPPHGARPAPRAPRATGPAGSHSSCRTGAASWPR